MRKKKLLFITIQQFVFLTYFILTTTIFFLALAQGNEGVTLKVFGGSDDGVFYWEQVKNIVAGREAIITSIYPLILGNIIKITEIESVYVIRVFNYLGFLLLVFSSIYLVKLLLKHQQKRMDKGYIDDAKIYLLISFLFYVSLQINLNLSIYRDVWIYTLYVISAILSMKFIFYKKNKFLHLILFVPVIWLLGEFRGYAVLSFFLTILLYFSYKILRNIKKPLLISIIFVVLFGLYYTFFMDFKVPIVDMSLREALNYRKHFLSGNAAGGSQMWITLDHSFFGMFFINYIHSYLGNLLGPLPWHINGITTLIMFLVETIPMIIILRFLWKNRSLISRLQKYILLHAFVWVSLIAITNDNLGTAARLRPVAWILILIVFTCVFSYSRIKKAPN